VVTADAAHVAAVADVLGRRLRARTYDRHAHDDETFAEGVEDFATVAVETLTPLIRAQVAESLTPGVTAAILAAYGLGRDDEAACAPFRNPESTVSVATSGATP
jgi:hypothetical protein